MKIGIQGPLREARDLRKEYANKLRAMADLVENYNRQPLATRVIVLWDDGQATTCAKDEPHANKFAIIGVLDWERSKTLTLITQTPILDPEKKDS
jgi:hypothetical protein